MGGGTLALFSRGGTLLPFLFYADARYIDAVIVSKAVRRHFKGRQVATLRSPTFHECSEPRVYCVTMHTVISCLVTTDLLCMTSAMQHAHQ